MPIVKIDMLEGRSEEQKNKLFREVTDAIVRTIDARPESVTIILNEQPLVNLGKAGKPLAETMK